MPRYRFYLLNMASAIEDAAAVLTYESDAAAVLSAEELFYPKKARFSGFDLWPDAVAYIAISRL